MKNSKTPKIVVAVGLVAVYATGFALVTLRDAPNNNVSKIAEVAPAAQMADDFVPPAIETAAIDSSTSVEAPAPVASTVANNVEEKVLRKEPAVAQDQAITKRVTESPTESSEVAKTAPTMEVAATSNGPANSNVEAPPSEQAVSASSGNDNQITADVRTQIAAVAPVDTVEVTTKDGVVALTGSVPSQEEVDKMWLFASNVADVLSVNVSELMISN